MRGTGAVSKLITRDVCQKLRRVLEEGGIEVKMLKMYVDDGRLVVKYVEKGAIYNPILKKIEYTEEQKKVDTEREKEGETVDHRIKRLIIPIMNDINKDLEWTVELEEDFKDDVIEGRENDVKRGIPTLDFEVYWDNRENKFSYRYYEKKMRNPVVIQKRSAMDRSQKIGILSQELIRRLSNVSEGREETEEKIAVVEGYTKQLKQSGYNFMETQEIIRSGYTGLVRKRNRRKESGLPMHREGTKTLVNRTRKKLLDKKMWYRREKEKEENERKGVRKQRREEMKGGKKDRKTVEVKSVVFIQQTKDSRLVKRLREVEERLGETTGYRIKFVEKVGEKLVDILCQSNPWKGNNCLREDCILCETKEETGKGRRQCCSSRNVTYETWCGTCEDREKERIEKESKEERKDEIVKNKGENSGVKLHKYVGETGRSVYERGKEHKKDRIKWDKGSHMLKHIVEEHEEEDDTEIKFRMRIIRNHRSAFERQIFESIRIQNERRNHNILNSRTEYNRCALPRLEVRVGERKTKQRDKEKEIEEEKEAEIEKKIVKRKKNHIEKGQLRVEDKEKHEDKDDERKDQRESSDEKGTTVSNDKNVIKMKGEKKKVHDTKRGNNMTYKKGKITRYVNVSEKKNIMEVKKGERKTSPLENNWELAMRLKEIIIENDEKWRRFEKEKEEVRKRYREKEERFEMIREKKRKWSERITTQEGIGEEDSMIKKIEHYEMWWNLWERRRGERTSLERSIEKGEEKMRMEKWKKEEKKAKASPVGLVWEEFEETLESIDMDEIWKEENEPKEEEQKESTKKKPRLELIEDEDVGSIANKKKETVTNKTETYEKESKKLEKIPDNIVGKGRKDIPNTGAEKEQTRKEEGKGVKGEKVRKNREKEKESGRKEKFKLETPEEMKVRTPSVKKFFLRSVTDNSVRKTGKTAGNTGSMGENRFEYSGVDGSGLGGSKNNIGQQVPCKVGDEIVLNGSNSEYSRNIGELQQQQRRVNIQSIGSGSELRRVCARTSFERQIQDSTEQL